MKIEFYDDGFNAITTITSTVLNFVFTAALLIRYSFAPSVRAAWRFLCSKTVVTGKLHRTARGIKRLKRRHHDEQILKCALYRRWKVKFKSVCDSKS